MNMTSDEYQDYLDGQADHQLMVEALQHQDTDGWTIGPIVQFGAHTDPPMWEVRAGWLTAEEMVQFAHALLDEVETSGWKP